VWIGWICGTMELLVAGVTTKAARAYQGLRLLVGGLSPIELSSAHAS
jgi:hypothetical protein